MDAAEYKHVVLGLIFLKYVSDSFEEKYRQLLAEGYGDEEDRDEYLAENIFYVPKDARWSEIQNHAASTDIGSVIDHAMDAIEKENNLLKGVLTKNYSRPELDKTRLGELVTLFTNIEVGSTAAQERDVLGRVYEYFLGKFASAEGKLGGEFYTPSCIVRTLSFHDDQHKMLKANYILANPPFNISDWGKERLQEDIRWKYGIPPAGNANFAWLQHMLHHLNPAGGVCGTVLANGSLSSNTSNEGTIRANMVKGDVVECIVAMPGQLFYSTGIPVSLWILRKGKGAYSKGKVLFMDKRP